MTTALVLFGSSSARCCRGCAAGISKSNTSAATKLAWRRRRARPRRRAVGVHRFVARPLAGGLFHAWLLESLQRQRRGWPFWSSAYGGLTSVPASPAFATLAFLAGGVQALVPFLLQAAWFVTLLAIMNHVECYGLRRRGTGERYERVTPRRSWSTKLSVSNWPLFDLQRHTHRHSNMDRPYERLRTGTQAPQLAAGYSTMVLAASLPSLWFRSKEPRRVDTQEGA